VVTCRVVDRKHLIQTLLALFRFLNRFSQILLICFPFSILGMNWVTSFCSNNASPALSLLAQDSMLKHFLKRSTYEVKASANHELNYVVFQRSKQFPTAHLRKSPSEKERTLVLMHGFGLGLGFFYGTVLPSDVLLSFLLLFCVLSLQFLYFFLCCR
jgi:hypothetical protein